MLTERTVPKDSRISAKTDIIFECRSLGAEKTGGGGEVMVSLESSSSRGGLFGLAQSAMVAGSGSSETTAELVVG